jgi:hypothetical protein
MTIEQPPPEREIPPGPPEPDEPEVPPEVPPRHEPEWRAPGGPDITDAPMRLPGENPDVETEI